MWFSRLTAPLDRRMAAYIAAGRTRAEQLRRLDELATFICWGILLGSVGCVALIMFVLWLAVQVTR